MLQKVKVSETVLRYKILRESGSAYIYRKWPCNYGLILPCV